MLSLAYGLYFPFLIIDHHFHHAYYVSQVNLTGNQKVLAQQKESPRIAMYRQARQSIYLEKERLRCIKQLNKLNEELRELQKLG
ncbi:MAG: hypothetical protein ACE5R6_17655 [Candidatus Heimdallarchaeota archaeon]